MKVLVTGGRGFIGSEIIKVLNELKYEITQIAGKNSRGDSLKKETNIFFADVSTKENLAEIEKIQNLDAVIHSAGLAHQFGDTEKEDFQRVNTIGAKNVSELAVGLKVKQFILISSTAVYGIKKAPDENKKKTGVPIINEESECAPETFYAQSKLEAEKVCREICEKNNIALTILRLAPVIGEGSSGNVSRLIESIDKNRFLRVGSGRNWKSLIYKRDVARACAEILAKKTDETEIFNLAASPVRMDEFVAEICAGLNKKIPGIIIPPSLLRGVFKINSKSLRIKKIEKFSQTIEKWLSDDVYAGDRIAEKYDFAPETTIREALAKQIGWYRGKKPSIDRAE